MKKIAQYLLITLFIFFLIKYFKDKQNEILIITNITPLDLVRLTIATLLINFIYAHKLLLILKKLGLKEIFFLPWLKIFIVSRFMNLFITQAALVYRGFILKKDYNFSYTNSISMAVFFTWFETISMMILSILIFGFFFHDLQNMNTILTILLGLTLFLIIVPFLAQRLIQKKSYKAHTIQWIAQKANDLASNAILATKDMKFMFKMSSLNILTFCFQIIWMYLCMRALHLNVAFTHVVLFVVVIQLAGAINIVPGNIGLTETLCGFLSTSIGWNFGNGVIISITSRIILYLAFAVAGLFIWGPKNIKFRKQHL